MNRLAMTAAITLLPIIASAQQAITIQSPPNTFRVNSTAQATISKDGPFLKVVIEKHAIWAPGDYKYPNDIVSYTAAIATDNSDKNWKTQRHSEPVKVSLTLNPGETRQIPATTLLIPIDGMRQLDKYWVVLSTKLKSPESSTGYGYTYAHSEKLNLPPHR